MLDYIFLDLDGPLLDGKKKHFQCYKDIILKYGGSVLDIDEYWSMKRAKVKRNIIIEKSFFMSSYDVFLEEWLKNIENEYYLTFDELKPYIIDTLTKWKTITKNIVLVTMRQNRKNLIHQLEKLGVFILLDEVIDCSPQVKNAKYEALKDKTFRNAVFIGDTEEDTKTAKMLNIKSIGITNGLREKKHLDADYYYEEIKDINFDKLGI